MADVVVAPLVPGATGKVEAAQTLSASDTFKIPNNGKMCLRLEETSLAGSSTVTVVTNLTVGGLAVADQAVSVGSGVKKYVGPFPTSLYGDPISVTSSDADIDMQAVQL